MEPKFYFLKDIETLNNQQAKLFRQVDQIIVNHALNMLSWKRCTECQTVKDQLIRFTLQKDKLFCITCLKKTVKSILVNDQVITFKSKKRKGKSPTRISSSKIKIKSNLLEYEVKTINKQKFIQIRLLKNNQLVTTILKNHFAEILNDYINSNLKNLLG